LLMKTYPITPGEQPVTCVKLRKKVR